MEKENPVEENVGQSIHHSGKVPLKEQLIKKRLFHYGEVEKLSKLIKMLNTNPEIEVHQDFNDLLRSIRREEY